jgi:flagellar biosynthesis/type III secretory pathway protein FliH
LSTEAQALRAFFPSFDRAAQAAAVRAASGEPAAPAPETEPVRTRERREAFAAGFAEGQRAAVQAARTEQLTEAVKTLVAAAEHLALRRMELAAEVERAMPPLILELARAVIHTEVERCRPALEALVRDIAARVAAEDGPVTVRLAPATAAAFHEVTDVPGDAVKVESDATLRSADFVIETHEGVVDGRVDVKLEEAWAALTEVAP